MPQRFKNTRDTPSGDHEIAVELLVPVVEMDELDQPRLMLKEDQAPWFLAIPRWWRKK